MDINEINEQLPDFNSIKNWKEDYPHENGNYICRCTMCGSLFYGHKRRVICKVCDTQLRDMLK